MSEKISLAGDLGSGKSTVSKILIDVLGAEYYSTGAIVRSVAEKRGMTVVELNKYMETHPELDNEIDAGIAALTDDPRRLIIDSRMAWHFTKGTFKIYLSTDIETSALRIMSANRQGEHAASLEGTINDTRARRESEKKRYFEQYGVDIKDLSNYDLIVDTTYATPEVIADCIVNCFEKWCLDKSFSGVYISPERLNYPEREIDADVVSSLAAKLELGEPIPMPEIAEENGEFYLVSGFESAMAYSMSFSDFVVGKLVKEKLACEYVKMRNSL